MRKLYRKLIRRYQFVIKDPRDLSELRRFRWNYAGLFCAVGSLVLGSMVGGWGIGKFVHTRYSQASTAKPDDELQQLLASVKTLEQQAQAQAQHVQALQRIISGGQDTQASIHKEPSLKPGSPVAEFGFTESSAILQTQREADPTPLVSSTSSKTVLPTSGGLSNFLFVPPVQGVVTQSCVQVRGHLGIDIVASENAPIRSVADGVVVFTDWGLETGWVMVVQHADDVLSVYKHNATLIKKTGARVEAGEFIAILGNSGDLTTGPHLHFELWYRGSPLNPEEFFVF